MNAIYYYLNNILIPKLKSFGVSELFTIYMTNSILIQMTSLLRHWDDIPFRNALLLIGLEEGLFYKPLKQLEIRCFVVVTIRNSPIETLQSNDYTRAGLKNSLLIDDIKEITSEAIEYFSKQNFHEMCIQAKLSPIDDLYLNLANKHPVAWTALQQLSMTNKISCDYPMVPINNPYNIEDLYNFCTNKPYLPTFTKVEFDGYSMEIEAPLKEYLILLASNKKVVFIVDSFKSLTRNFSKLIKILEFLLTRNLIFVSSNYYLENGHVERRINPLKAAHNVHETKQNLSNTNGLGYKHKQILKHYYNKIK